VIGMAYVIFADSLLRIDRVGTTAQQDRPYYSGKHDCMGSTCSPRRPGRAAR
jgi:hypothetical protein